MLQEKWMKTGPPTESTNTIITVMPKPKSRLVGEPGLIFTGDIY